MSSIHHERNSRRNDLTDLGEALGPEFVLSRSKGPVRAPKDFDWIQKNIPCQAACPAQTDIPGYLDAIAHGDYEAAYRINLSDNVFPAVLGRVCTRPCEPACRHGWEGLGEPVAICFSKRSAADFFSHSNPIVLEPYFEASGKRVAVVGAGAAGLTVARELCRCGHAVDVLEKHDKPGGLMTFGIPSFRLPRDVVEREIEQVRACGVQIKCGVEVGSEPTLNQLISDYDAVVVASGALRPNIPAMPGNDLEGVRHGLPFLVEANTAGTAEVGESVVVIGGGFTAVDCARMARRLGAKQVGMFYRRTEAEMYITADEIEEMCRENITFETRVAPVAIRGENGRVTAVEFIRTRPGATDPNGRARPQPIPGSEFEVTAEMVLLGTGQLRDFSWMRPEMRAALVGDGEVLKSGTGAATRVNRLFVAGDVATGPGSVIDAIGHAKSTVREVDLFLSGKDRFQDAVWIEDATETGRTRAMDDIPRQDMPVLPTDERGREAEVERGFDKEAARTEAQRCYLCRFKYEIDNEACIYCDRCLKVKPVEGCIVKVSALAHDETGRISGLAPSKSNRDYNMLYIDQNECIRCGACADVCPVECISLQKVSLRTFTI